MREPESSRTLREKKALTLGGLLLWGRKALGALGRAEASSSAERILSGITGHSRTVLYLESKSKASGLLVRRFQSLIKRRKNREPVAYLLGKAHFWEETLAVGEGCLIPRPETETLVEKFIRESGFKKGDVFPLLDLGSGSGAIGIALLRIFPNATATFSDISEQALKVTRQNIRSYELQRRSEIVLSNLFKGLQGRKWRAILSNPPYFSGADWRNVQPEILKEPRRALDGGRDGLDFYRRIAREAPLHLEAGGWLAMECGMGQARKITAWFERDFTGLKVFCDDAGIERVLIARKILNG